MAESMKKQEKKKEKEKDKDKKHSHSHFGDTKASPEKPTMAV